MKHPLFIPLHTHYRSIEIRTLQKSDIRDLATIMWQDQTIYQAKYQLNNIYKCELWLSNLIEEFYEAISHPLVVCQDGKFVGITSFHSFNKVHLRVTMGGTWIFPHARQSNINTEMKMWALSYLIDDLKLNRVEFCVDEKNYPSQMAMIRLGVHFEGDRNNYYTSVSGETSSAKVYSCTKTNWPQVKQRIQGLLMDHINTKLVGVPEVVVAGDIYLRRYRLRDARELIGLIINNRDILKDSFPNQGKWNCITDAETGIAHWAQQWIEKRAFFWGIFNTQSQKLIGQAIMKSIDWTQGSVDIGYYLDLKYHGLGLGKKSIYVIENIARELKLYRLSARVFPENQASLNALRSRNFLEEGRLVNAFRNSQGILQDTNLLAKIIQ